MIYTLIDLDRMVRTIWGEARKEPEETWSAIAQVIITRANWPGRAWWGSSIEEVCTAPWQFACWNPSDPNRHKMLNLAPKDRRYREIETVCLALLTGGEPISTESATYYCHSMSKPVWRGDREPIETVGKFDFFNIRPEAFL